MKEKEIGRRIKQRREQLKLTQDILGKELSLNKSTIQRYEAGLVSTIKLPVLQAMARVLDVDPNWLALKTDAMGSFYETPQEEYPLPSNIIRLDKVRYIPLLGRIACGKPIFAEENIIEKILLPSHVNATFALLCQGDSMTGANIEDGDTVFIREQPEVENGEIAAVMIDDFESEATLKKVYQDNNKITLMPMNPSHDPFTYVGKEMNKVRIIGKAVAILKKLEQ